MRFRSDVVLILGGLSIFCCDFHPEKREHDPIGRFLIVFKIVGNQPRLLLSLKQLVSGKWFLAINLKTHSANG